MKIDPMNCTWCSGSGRKCDVCGFVPVKVKKKSYYKPKEKQGNRWGCTCQKNEYCGKCRTDKITAEGKEKWIAFLEQTWHKLKKYNLATTGHPEIDFAILETFGAWKTMQPQIVLIPEAVKREDTPV